MALVSVLCGSLRILSTWVLALSSRSTMVVEKMRPAMLKWEPKSLKCMTTLIVASGPFQTWVRSHSLKLGSVEKVALLEGASLEPSAPRKK